MRLPDDERRPNGAPSRPVPESEPILPSAEAEASPTCRRCGHPLTADESVRRLLGPTCARHVKGAER